MKAKAPNTQRIKRRRAKGTKRSQSELLEERLRKVLVDAEVGGVLRWILRGAGKALLHIESQGSEWSSPVGVDKRRQIVVRHVVSLVRELDTQTRAQIAHELISDLCCRSSKVSREDAKKAGLAIEPNQQFAGTFFFILGLVVHACCELVSDGNEDFATEMLLETSEMVRTVNDLARRKPQVFEGVASERIDWPVMAARHYPKKSDFKQLADRIQLASKCAVQPRNRHTWKPNTIVNNYLLRMLSEECWGDRRTLTKANVAYYLNSVLMPLFEKVAEEEGGWENYLEFAAIAKNAAKRGKKGVQRSEVRSRVARALKAMAI